MVVTLCLIRSPRGKRGPAAGATRSRAVCARRGVMPRFELRLDTADLTIVPCTVDVARASLQGSPGVTSLTGVRVPPTWPPDDLRDALRLYAAELEGDASHLGWGVWLLLTRKDASLAGSVGFKGKPDEDGCVEIGYGTEPAYRRRGYAGQAVPALLRWGFGQGVRRVVAECRADNPASLSVLRRSGMTQTSSNAGMTWWEARVARP